LSGVCTPLNFLPEQEFFVPYFRVDVKTELHKTFAIEAANALDAEIMARQAAIQNKSFNEDTVCKVEECSQISATIQRLPDDGDLYRNERVHMFNS
jgi:hypothetical protein